MEECTIEKQINIRLSLEPAYQVIYWSLCWLFFFLSLIGFLEAQHISMSIIFGSVSLILFYFGFGSKLTLSKTSLKLSYFRGVKATQYSIAALTKVVYSEERLIQLNCSESTEPILFYLNQKNKNYLLEKLQQISPSLGIAETKVFHTNNNKKI